MRVSIRLRLLIILNLVVLATTGAIGFLAARVSGDVVEERLVRQVVTNTIGLLENEHVPITDTLMGHLRQLFSVHFAAVEATGDELIATSLPAEDREAIQSQLQGAGDGGAVVIADVHYRLASQTLSRRDATGRFRPPVRIYALVDEDQFRDARQRAAARVGLLAAIAAAGASALVLVLSRTITRPIRSLADEMDHIASAEVNADPAAGPVRRGPTELLRLATSFDALIARLGDAQRQMARAERLAAVGKVAAGVVHELRNPLSAIKMNARILQDELRQAGLDTNSVDLMLQEVDRMDVYLHELMNLATGADGDMNKPAASGSSFLSEVAESVLSIMKGRCDHAGILVEVDHQADRPVKIEPSQLRQVIMNLLINAIEAMPDGGTIRMGDRAADDRVRFTVEDTGGGIDPGVGGDIFDAFVSTKPAGAGLGLYLCKRIIEGHSGRIGYENPDAGAQVWFELPAADA